jgi:ribosomal protein S12 methylthiotransferase
MSSRSQPSINRTFHVESLGCAKNQVDSELMISALERAGWTLAPGADDAEVLIVNTCGFISQARKESIETTLELKTLHPDRKVIMVGCLSERYGQELARELPEIDGFLGNRDPARIVELVDGPRAAAGPAEPERAYERTHLLSYPGSAYVKIAEGCANRCTYCAIPLIRGDLASRTRPQIREEIRGLLESGVRECILIAQDLGSFGADRGSAELGALLGELHSLPGDFWVRLLYIHPDHFPSEILPLFQADPRFLPYFDLPFQHASPGILRAMGRKSDPNANLELLAMIRAALPGAVIRSTFLVGFPGESGEDFKGLLDFQERARLDWLGAFTYSREEDTPAYSMKERVPKKTAEERKTEVERRQIPITDRALNAQIGRTLDVLVEERLEGEAMSIGRSYLQAPDVDGLVVVRAALAPGTMVRVRITRRNGVDLEGEVVER